MSAFVCGYIVVERNVLSESLRTIQQIAADCGLAIRYGHLDLLPEIVDRILVNATHPVPPGSVPFLITTRELLDVSDGVIDVDDDLVDTRISLRQAVLARLEPLRILLQRIFESRCVREIVIVTSLGLDTTYSRDTVDAAKLPAVVADAYEREGQVPSLCLAMRSPGHGTD